MGNKSGKFNVPSTGPVNKDLVNENDVKNDEGQNGDTVQQEISKVDESAPPSTPKKKNIFSWLKKLSGRKEKKPNTAKENGAKEEVIESPKENGDITEEVKHTEETPAIEVTVANGHTEHCQEETEIAAVETVEKAEETHLSNGHEFEQRESPAVESN